MKTRGVLLLVLHPAACDLGPPLDVNRLGPSPLESGPQSQRSNARSGKARERISRVAVNSSQAAPSFVPGTPTREIQTETVFLAPAASSSRANRSARVAP